MVAVVWQARWIWCEAPPFDRARLLNPPTPGPESWNRFVQFRRSFTLDAVPASVPCRVTADSRYVLFLNGRDVGRGPARAVPERLTWAELDLAPELHEGENVVAALVRFYGRPIAWWRPARPSFQLGYGSFLLEAPA